MTTPPLAEVIASPDYGVISRSIADTIAKCTKPLTDTQRAVLAPSLAVWCEKLIADALRTSAASLRDEGDAADATRYRFLRDRCVSGFMATADRQFCMNCDEPASEWDAAIDAATQPAAQEKQA